MPSHENCAKIRAQKDNLTKTSLLTHNCFKPLIPKSVKWDCVGSVLSKKATSSLVPHKTLKKCPPQKKKTREIDKIIMLITFIKKDVYSESLKRHNRTIKGGSGSRVWFVISQSQVQAQSKAPAVIFSKRLYSNCLVLISSRNGFKHNLHMHKCN